MELWYTRKVVNCYFNKRHLSVLCTYSKVPLSLWKHLIELLLTFQHAERFRLFYFERLYDIIIHVNGKLAVINFPFFIIPSSAPKGALSFFRRRSKLWRQILLTFTCTPLKTSIFLHFDKRISTYAANSFAILITVFAEIHILIQKGAACAIHATLFSC